MNCSCPDPKLGYLVSQAGYFHDGHRPLDDCQALLEVLDCKSHGQVGCAFAELNERSQRSRVCIFAEHSRFDLKDQLKGRGYRWSDGRDGRLKAWWTEVSDADPENELCWLHTEIYRYEASPPMKRMTAFDRFKG